MEFLNNPQNRDIKNVIYNYVNNVNLKFNRGYLELKYYISETSTFKFNTYLTFHAITKQEMSDNYLNLKVKVFSEIDGTQSDYDLNLILEDKIFLIEFNPHRQRDGDCGHMSLTIDYLTNKEDIDKLIKYIQKYDDQKLIN